MGNEDITVQNYATRNPLFPHEPTSDQAFSFEQFEAYRRLGYQTGCDLAQELGINPKALWSEEISHSTRYLVKTFRDAMKPHGKPPGANEPGKTKMKQTKTSLQDHENYEFTDDFEPALQSDGLTQGANDPHPKKPKAK